MGLFCTPRTTLAAANGVLIFGALSFGCWRTTDEDRAVAAWLVVSAVGGDAT